MSAELVVANYLRLATSENIRGRKDHELALMVDQIPDTNPLKARLRALEHLSEFATTFRYPTPSGRIKEPPAAADLATYIADVETALADALAGFGVDLAKPNTPATSARPLR